MLVKDFDKLKPEEFYNKYNEQLELEDCFDEDEFIESYIELMRTIIFAACCEDNGSQSSYSSCK